MLLSEKVNGAIMDPILAHMELEPIPMFLTKVGKISTVYLEKKNRKRKCNIYTTCLVKKFP